MSDTQSDPSNAESSDTSKPLSEADTTKAQHNSVTPDDTHIWHTSTTYTHVSQSYIDRLISKLIGPHSSTGMSLLRFVITMLVGSIALPIALIVYALAYVCGMAAGILEVIDHKLWGADKDMVTKDKSHKLPEGKAVVGEHGILMVEADECHYCDSLDHVTSECPHYSHPAEAATRNLRMRKSRG